MAKSASTVKTPHHTNRQNVNAGVAGAGGGTLILLLAKNIPDTYAIKSWLVILSPSLSVVFAWVFKKINSYYRRQIAEVLKTRLRGMIEVALTDPSLTDEDRNKLKEQLKELALADIELLSERIRSINSAIKQDGE